MFYRSFGQISSNFGNEFRKRLAALWDCPRQAAPHKIGSGVDMSDPLTPYGNKPMVTPIVNAVNYEYRDFEVLRQITDGEIDGYTYHRDDNPTVRAVERKIAAMEGAEDCIVCTSGMAACTLVYLTYLKAGDHLILFHDIYGANYKVSLILERLGVNPNTVRLSVGIEPPDKILDDLLGAVMVV
jgi:cystathionine beta-lyase/cystathionine gamma-synthase